MLAMHWRGDAFTPEQKHANFDYYEGLTVRDSSLSASTQSVLAAEVGHLEPRARLPRGGGPHGPRGPRAQHGGRPAHGLARRGGARGGGRLRGCARLRQPALIPAPAARGDRAPAVLLEVRGRCCASRSSHEEAKYSLSAGDAPALPPLGRGGQLEGGSAVGLPIPPRRTSAPSPPRTRAAAGARARTGRSSTGAPRRGSPRLPAASTPRRAGRRRLELAAQPVAQLGELGVLVGDQRRQRER